MGLALKVFFGIFIFANFVYAEISANVDVKLSPAGSFKLVTKDVKGKATKHGNSVSAQNIMVVLSTLNSGIALRDEHTKNKYLEVSKFPHAILVSAKGENGKGTGIIKIKGIEKPISGTYNVKGNELEAQFDLKLSDFGISGIKYMGVGVADLVKISVTLPLAQGVAQATPQQQRKSGVKPSPYYQLSLCPRETLSQSQKLFLGDIASYCICPNGSKLKISWGEGASSRYCVIEKKGTTSIFRGHILKDQVLVGMFTHGGDDTGKPSDPYHTLTEALYFDPQRC